MSWNEGKRFAIFMALVIVVVLALALALSCMTPMAQDMPYPITSNDPEFLDRAIREIYNRIHDKIWTDTIWAKVVRTDTLRRDSIGIIFMDADGLYIQSASDGDQTTSLRLYENPVWGSNYTGLSVQTNRTTDFQLMLPDATPTYRQAMRFSGDGAAGFEFYDYHDFDSLIVNALDADTIDVELLYSGTTIADTTYVKDLDADTATTTLLFIDTLRAPAGQRFVTLYTEQLKIQDLHGTTPRNAVIYLYEDPDVGSDFIGFSVPSNVTTSHTLTFPPTAGSSSQFLQTNGGGTLSWANSPAWSKTGDTLMQHGSLTMADGVDYDTVSLSTAYSNTSYSVSLQWVEGTSSPPAAGADTLWNYCPTSNLQLSTSSFIIHATASGAKVIRWMTMGN